MKLLLSVIVVVLPTFLLVQAQNPTPEVHLVEFYWENGQIMDRFYAYEPEGGGSLVRHGRWQSWYENGKLSRDSIYEDGELVREHRWTTNPGGGEGNPHFEWIIEMVDGDEYKWERAWNDDGSIGHIYNTLNGNLHGHQQIWYENGTPAEDSYYVEGTLHGRYRSWWESGALEQDLVYVDGMLEGEALWYFEDGTPDLFAEYKEGQFHGISTDYLADGSLKSVIGYYEGLRDGLEIIYNGDDQPRSQYAYSHGLKDGTFSEWSSAINTGERYLRLTGAYRDDIIPVGQWKLFSDPSIIASRIDWEYQYNNDGRVTSARSFLYPEIEPNTRLQTFEASGSPDRLTGWERVYDWREDDVVRLFEYIEFYGHFSDADTGTHVAWNRDAYHGVYRQWALSDDNDTLGQYYLQNEYDRFVNDTLQGEYRYYLPNGQLGTRIQYVNGKQVAYDYFEYTGVQAIESRKSGELWDVTLYVTEGTYEGEIDAKGPATAAHLYYPSSGCGDWVLYGVTPENPDTWTAVDTVNYGDCNIQPTVPPEPNNPNVTPAYTVIRGTVRDKDTRQPIAGADVDGATQIVQTDQNGYFELVEETGVDVNLSVSHKDYFGYREIVLTDERQVVRLSVELAFDPNGRDPHVSNLEGRYSRKSDGFFLAGVPVDEEYWSWIDWNDEDPGTVSIFINEQEIQLSDLYGENIFSQTVDVSEAFTESADNVNTVQMTATNLLGNEVESQVKHPVLCPQPGWAQPFGDFTASYNVDTRYLEYTLHTSFPSEPFSFLVTQDTVNGLAGDVGGAAVWTAWELIPFIGGEEFGIKPTYAEFDLKILNNGSGRVKAGGKTGFVAFGKELEGELKGQGTLGFKSGSGLEFGRAQVDYEIKGKLGQSAGLADLIPGLSAADDWPLFIGKTVKAFSAIAEASVSVAPTFSQTLQFTQDNGEVVIEPVSGDLSVSLELGISTTLYKLLKASLTGRGTALFNYEIPSDYGLTSFEFSMGPKLALQAASWKREFEYQYVFSLPYEEPMAMNRFSAAPVLRKDSGWHLTDRDFLIRPVSQRWVGDAVAALAFTVDDYHALDTGTEAVLVENPYTLPEPDLARRGDIRAVVWVHHDGGIPTIVQANEIKFAYYDGSNWGGEEQITDDFRSDYQPKVAIDNNGLVVVVWVHTAEDGLTDDITLDDMVPHWEILCSYYDPSAETPSWSTPVSLTDNAYADFAPELTRGADGSIRLFWQSNPASTLEGTEANPTSIHTAVWDEDGQAFGTVQTLSETFTGWPEFAYTGGSDATVVWVDDADGDILTGDDTDLMSVSGSGSTWGAAVAITDDSGGTAVADNGPLAVTLSDGTVAVLWRRGNGWVWVPDLGTPVTTALSDDVGEFTMQGAQAATLGNNIALAWTSLSETGPDIAARVYDAANAHWSERVFLTDSLAKEETFVLVGGSDNVLDLVAHTTDADSVSSDLIYESMLFGVDLAFSESEPISVDPADALPGETVTVTVNVSNRGLLAAPGGSVSVYEGDPEAGGTLLGNFGLTPNPVPGGSDGQASFNRTVPEDGSSPEFTLIIDEGDSIAESDETNNSLTVKPFLPDVSLEGNWLVFDEVGSPGVAIEVANSGAVSAADVYLTIEANAVVYGAAEIPVLLPGRRETVIVELAESDLREVGELLVIVADPDQAIAEINEFNNVNSGPPIVTDDLDRDGLPDTWEYGWIDASASDAYSSLISLSPNDDTDEDGLTVAEEYEASTDPFKADTDNDTLPDGWEVAYQLDPNDLADADDDGDGDDLDNTGEYAASSNPTLADTDEDGLEDGDEVYNHNSDPTLTDTDGDGVSDYDEITLYGSLPSLVDSEGDGMDDGWEIFYGLIPYVDDSAENTDGDDLTHLEEYNAGTNPLMADTDGDGLSDSEEVFDYLTDPTLADSDGDGQSDGNETAAGTNPLDDLEYPDLTVATSSLPIGNELLDYAATLEADYSTAPETWTLDYATYNAVEDASFEAPSCGGAQGWSGPVNDWDLDLPFDFPYYTHSYSRIILTDSGALYLGSYPDVSLTPSTEVWQNAYPMLSPLLNLYDFSDEASDVFVDMSVPGEVTVCWKGEYGNLGPGIAGEPVDAGITLYSNGEFVFFYGAGNVDGGWAVYSAGDGMNANRIDRVGESMNGAAALHVTPANVLPRGLALSMEGNLTGVPDIFSNTSSVFLVRDDAGREATKALNLEIDLHPNLRPEFLSSDPTAGEVRMGEADLRVLTVNANDPEDQQLGYRWVLNGQEQPENSATLTVETDWGDAGAWSLVCYLSDDFWIDEKALSWSIVISDDNDGDQLANSYENANYPLDPNLPDERTDHDRDGLDAIQEQEQGTHPGLYDTDGDGLSDGWEVANNKNPLVPDTVSLDPSLSYLGMWEDASGFSSVGDAAVDGDYLYTAASYSGFKVLDISDRTQVETIFSNTTQTDYVALLAGNRLMASGFNGQVLYDVSNPASPSIIKAYPLDFSLTLNAIGAWGDELVLSLTDWNLSDPAFLRLQSYADPENPVIEGDSSYFAVINDFSIEGGRAAVATGATGVFFVDLNPAEGVLPDLGSYTSNNIEYLKAAIRGNLGAFGGYHSDGYSLIDIVDISDPASPVLLGRLAVGDYGSPLVWLGNVLAFADTVGIHLVADGESGWAVVDTHADASINSQFIAGVDNLLVYGHFGTKLLFLELNTGDSDGNGLEDGWEGQYFETVPANPEGDPDGDGLTNAQEQLLGTNPKEKDSDGDGTDDGDEIAQFRDPAVNDPIVDSDGDLISDEWEALFGTDAYDPQDKPDMQLNLENGNLMLRWQGANGRRYHVEESEDLFHWTLVPGTQIEADEDSEIDVILLPEGSNRFYRLKATEGL